MRSVPNGSRDSLEDSEEETASSVAESDDNPGDGEIHNVANEEEIRNKES